MTRKWTINIDLRISADNGKPLVEKNPSHEVSKIFLEMAFSAYKKKHLKGKENIRNNTESGVATFWSLFC